VALQAELVLTLMVWGRFGDSNLGNVLNQQNTLCHINSQLQASVSPGVPGQPQGGL
jgi:hypothetical protein